MPCDSKYLEATPAEVALSQALCLLEELDGKEWQRNWWDGYHPKAYNAGPRHIDLDSVVARLCARLQKVDVTQYSLEMQMWWRDHQKADKERESREQGEALLRRLQEQGLKKLTSKERRALGLEPQ